MDKKASKDDIKKAFRKLAQKYHPDRSSGDEGQFKEVNEAYQVLSNEKKRAEYDAYGQTFGGQGGQSSGWDFSGFTRGGFSGQGGQSSSFDFSEIFSDFFGGGGRRSRSGRRGNDISIDVQISFGESIFGVERRVMLTKHGLCNSCKGSGGEPGSKKIKCKTCNGRGSIHEARNTILGTITTERECPDCHMRGEMYEEKCKACRGEGIERRSDEISIAIPAGIENGEMIRMSGMGEAITGGVTGDLYVKIHVEPHQTFKRSGDDLTMDLPIKLSDALLGADYPISTLDGEIVLKIPAGISHGEILRVKGGGVPNQSGRGSLLARVVIKVPSKLSRKARKLVDELRSEGV